MYRNYQYIVLETKQKRFIKDYPENILPYYKVKCP